MHRLEQIIGRQSKLLIYEVLLNFNRCSHNEYMLSYLLSQATLRKKRKHSTPKEEQNQEDSQVVPHKEEEMQDLFDDDIDL